jgi:mitogen-activated protein kinase kinase
MQRQILRELSFNRSCHSAHIVRYYTSFLTLDSSSIAICMEYCAGRSLDNVYKQVKSRGGRTGERVLGKIACGVLGGLGYLHERKIIHRGLLFLSVLIQT